DGVKALNLKGDPAGAYQLFEEAIRADSTYAPAQFAISELLMDSAPDYAVSYARSAYMSDTTNYWYLSRYAQAVVTQGDYTLARDLYEKLIAIRPLDINAYRLLALLYQQESRTLEAISLLDTAEMRVGRNPYLSVMKQQFLLSTNQSDRAVRDAVAAVEEAPLVVENRVALAQLYVGLGRDSLARVEFDAAIEIDSTRIETLVAMANFYKSKGYDSEYLQTLRQIVVSDKMDVVSKVGLVKEVTARRDLYQRARVAVGGVVNALTLQHPNELEVVMIQVRHLITQGLNEEALLYLKSHLEYEPTQVEYYRAVVDIEQYMGRVDSMELYMRRAIDRFPDETSLNFEMAYLLVSQGSYDKAIEYYKTTLEGATDSLKSSVWGTVGDIMYQKLETEIASDSTNRLTQKRIKRRLNEVYGAYDRAIELFGDNFLVLNNYAYFLSENGGDLNVALAMAERVVAVQGSNPTYIDTYAWILYRLGRYEEAKSEMRRAISFDTTNNYEIALHYGEILAVLNEMTMAEFYWGKAKQWGASEELIESSRQRAKSIRGEE
ncbi:MAG: tetratricopeptide repeat protein, partial [Rikenellaceae bacterium]